MSELDLLKQEIEEVEGDLRRLRGSLQREGNGVKLKRIEIRTRTLDRLKSEKARLEKMGEVA